MNLARERAFARGSNVMEMVEKFFNSTRPSSSKFRVKSYSMGHVLVNLVVGGGGRQANGHFSIHVKRDGWWR